MINLHHELKDRQAMMKEAYRLLKKGGVLMIIDWKKEETPEGPPLLIRVTDPEMRDRPYSTVIHISSSNRKDTEL